MSADFIFDTSKDVNGSYIVYGRVADNEGVSKQIGILENGMPLNLTGFTITFEGITHEGKTKVFDTGGVTVVDAAKGTFKYTFPNSAFTVSGKYERAYFSLVKDSVRYTTADFEIVVFENADIDAEEAETIITEYNKLIAELYALQKSNIAELQKQQDEYIKTTDATFAAINQKITTLQTQITTYETNVTDAKNAAISTINAALEEFKAGDFYTKSEADAKFMLLKSAERSLLTLKNATVTVEDWNTLTTTGIYYCAAATGANMPCTGTLYGYLTIYNTLAVIIQKYEFQGAMYMRTYAGNPAAWGEWKKIAFSSEVVDLTQPQSIGGIKNFVDGLQMTGKEVAVQDQIPLCGIHGEGTNLSKIPNGTKIPIGPLVATDFGHEASDLPYTISSDGNTLTTTRACVLLFEGTIKIHGNNTLKYTYVKIRKNGSDTNFTSLGSSVNSNYMTAQSGQYVHTLAEGDKVEFTIEVAEGGVLFATQLLSLKITEVKAVQS
ncbi:hypothetical protein D920_01752 [Enterococcus faecalis 13-SD-W-01]|nr:hypothetical protein D920_01752 [Enterococcus faecalis 13-SD-W-01]